MLWDVFDTSTTPLQWATERCRAAQLPDGLAAAAANALAAQLADFSAATAPDAELAVENVAQRLRRLVRERVAAASAPSAAAGGAGEDGGDSDPCADDRAASLGVPELGRLLSQWGAAGGASGGDGGAPSTPAALLVPSAPFWGSPLPLSVVHAPPARATPWAMQCPPRALLRSWLAACRLRTAGLHPSMLLSLAWLHTALGHAAGAPPPSSVPSCVLSVAVDVTFARQRLRGSVSVDLWRDCCDGGDEAAERDAAAAAAGFRAGSGGSREPFEPPPEASPSAVGRGSSDASAGAPYWLAAVVDRAVASIRVPRAQGGGGSSRRAGSAAAEKAAAPTPEPSPALLFLLAAAVQRRVNGVLSAIAVADMATLEAIEAAAAAAAAAAREAGTVGGDSLTLTAAPPLPGTEAAEVEPEAAVAAATAPRAAPPQALLQPEHAAAALAVPAPPLCGLPFAVPPVIATAASARFLPLSISSTSSAPAGVGALLAVAAAH